MGAAKRSCSPFTRSSRKKPMIAPKHEKEEARLESLRRYAILDTPTEETFDSITRLIARICDAPIAVINLVDRDRQWFKSEIGLGVRETPLDISICAHAILQPGLFVVPDTAEDARFQKNPLVCGDPRLRFYAGALLESSDGLPLGTLCVLDYKPRVLTETQGETLLLLAKQVMTQIELRAQFNRVEELNSRLRRGMAESHHRIKNNLQSLSAVIDMQRMNYDDLVPVSELTRLSQHIRSLASLHDLLTQEAKFSGELDTVSLRAAIEKVVELIRLAHPGREIALELGEARLPHEKAATFVLLVNELISNALKHGRGRVEISLRTQGETVHFAVCDDGDGFPPNFDPKIAANTGLELIESIGRWDLRGVLEYRNRAKGGAEISLTFPVMSAQR